MREILFRGKLKSNGKWAYGNLNLKPNEYSIITPDETPLGTYGTVDPNTVGQYTGVTCNNEKVFEGDKLSDGYITYIVRWSPTACSFMAYGIGGDDGTWSLYHLCNRHNRGREVSIVGDIYDVAERVVNI